MAENTSRGLLSINSVEAYWYGSRLRSFFSRTLNQGLGPFFLFSLSLVAFFLDGRIVLQTADEDRTYVQNLIKVQTPLASPDQHAAILSLLLVGLNSPEFAGALYCPNANLEGSCLIGKLLATRTQELVSHLTGLDTLGDKTSFGFDVTPYVLALKKNIEDRKSTLPPSPDVIVRTPKDDTCKIDENHERRTNVFLLAQPRCDSGHDYISAGLVPQQAADALAHPSNQQVGAQVGLRDYRVRRALLDSRLFDVALKSLSPDIARATETERELRKPTITAAYFITINSVIRYSNFQRPNLNTELPPYKLWAAREYIEKIISKVETDRAVTTEAYVDFAGSGIVYTRCRAILAADNDPVISPAAVIGAVCVDYSLSEASTLALAHVIDRGPITRAVPLTVYGSSDDARWRFAEEDRVPRWATSAPLQRELDQIVSTLKTSTDDSRDIRLLPSKIGSQSSNEVSAHRTPDDLAKPSEIHPFFQSSENTFFVPTGINRKGETLAILLSVNGIGPFGSRPWPTFLAVLFAGLSIGALVAGASTSKELSEREGILSRLRSLQSAVIQTNSDDDLITAANDRAEDLTGQTLPVFGLQRSRSSMTFWQLFDKRTICMTPEMSQLCPIPTVLDESKLLMGSVDDIRHARQAGMTTSYFARLMKQRRNVMNEACANQWLRITAGPIFQPGRVFGAQDVSSTFGTIDTVPSEFAEVLERFIPLSGE